MCKSSTIKGEKIYNATTVASEKTNGLSFQGNEQDVFESNAGNSIESNRLERSCGPCLATDSESLLLYFRFQKWGFV
ncbi:hypothetical protein Trydic_g17565 [Trypoxylus dichotomus]